MGFVQLFSDKTATTLKSSAVVVYTVHVVLVSSSAVYWWWFVENGLTLVEFFPMKIEKCKESELCGEGMGDSANYWFTTMEEVHEEEGMMPLRQT